MLQNKQGDNDPGKRNRKNNDDSQSGWWLIVIAAFFLLSAVALVGFALIEHKDRISFLTVNALSTLVFVAIAMQVYIYRRQWRAMQGQLHAMKEQARIMDESLAETRNIATQSERAIEVSERNAKTAQDALYVSERAYIGIRNIEMSVGSNDEPSLTIIWINGGKTPAWHFRAEPTLVLSAKQETGKINFMDDSYTTDISGSFLPAGAERARSYPPENGMRITEEVWQELRSGSKTLSVIGAAYYVDFSGREQTFPIEAVCEVGPFSNRFVETYQYGAPKKKPN